MGHEGWKRLRKGNEMLKVTHLQRFSVHDGPGIRTTLFCKGCSLRCFWCHNPEAIESDIQLWYDKKQCIGCGSCRSDSNSNCRNNRDNNRDSNCGSSSLKGRDSCADVCPTGALSPTGVWMDEDELLEELLRDASHYRRTGGGITFSGGEPLLQAQSLRQIMNSRRLAGITKAVDTAGNVPWENFREVIPCTDLFLYDVKCMDPALHRKGTGADNGLIQENLERLCRTGKAIWIRIPVIPGWNDSEGEMRAVAQRLRQLSDLPQSGIERIQLLPFHRFGREKYERLGWEYPAGELRAPSEEMMENLLSLFQEMGLAGTEIGNHAVLADQI